MSDQEPDGSADGEIAHPDPPVNPTVESFIEAVRPAVQKLAAGADVPLHLLDPWRADR